MRKMILIAIGSTIMSAAAAAQMPPSDTLDEWCKTVKLPSSIAICSNPDLRALAIERQHAFDEAKSRLNQEQQKALLSDQNGWVRSYASACGLTDAPPQIPLPAAIKDCMAQAGRARVAYLRAYAGSPGSANTPQMANTSPKNPGQPISLNPPLRSEPLAPPSPPPQPTLRPNLSGQPEVVTSQELDSAWSRISSGGTSPDFETYVKLATPFLQQKRLELADLENRCRNAGPWIQVCNQQISIFKQQLERDETRKRNAENEIRRFYEKKEAAAREEREARAKREREDAIKAKLHTAADKGYRPLSVRDFTVDGKSLADSGAQIMVEGAFISENANSEYLVSGDIHSPNKVLLLTEDADRDTRRMLADCRDQSIGPYGMYHGCNRVHLAGTVTTCSFAILGQHINNPPCLKVTSGLREDQ